MSETSHTKATETAFKKLTIGDRLRWLIEAREIKQTELAAAEQELGFADTVI